jgi:hypothetical protein
MLAKLQVGNLLPVAMHNSEIYHLSFIESEVEMAEHLIRKCQHLSSTCLASTSSLPGMQPWTS